MLQRIQSVYLLLAVISKTLLFVIPFALHGETKAELFAHSSIATLIITLLAIGLGLFTIFQFNDRKKQMKLSKALMVVILLFFFAAHFAVHADPFTLSIEALKETYNVGMILPKLALLFTFLAHRGINKDEKLVQSVDRLR